MPAPTTPEGVSAVYGVEQLTFGPDYIIPKPFDPRLIVDVPLAVAKAAMESGVATRPLADLDAYRQSLSQRVFRSGLLMRPLFDLRPQRPAASRLHGRRGGARAARRAGRGR